MKNVLCLVLLLLCIIIIQEPTASTMDDSENNSHNVNAINLVENVTEASPDERPIGKIQLIRIQYEFF